MNVLVVAAVLTLFAVPSALGNPAADSCAGSLSAQGKLIYDATKPRIKPGVKLADEIRAATRPLVMGGKLSRAEAQAAAGAAGKCLAMIAE